MTFFFYGTQKDILAIVLFTMLFYLHTIIELLFWISFYCFIIIVILKFKNKSKFKYKSLFNCR